MKSSPDRLPSGSSFLCKIRLTILLITNYFIGTGVEMHTEDPGSLDCRLSVLQVRQSRGATSGREVVYL